MYIHTYICIDTYIYMSIFIYIHICTYIGTSVVTVIVTAIAIATAITQSPKPTAAYFARTVEFTRRRCCQTRICQHACVQASFQWCRMGCWRSFASKSRLKRNTSNCNRNNNRSNTQKTEDGNIPVYIYTYALRIYTYIYSCLNTFIHIYTYIQRQTDIWHFVLGRGDRGL